MHNYVYHLKWWVHVCVFLSDLGTLHIPITSTWFVSATLPNVQMWVIDSHWRYCWNFSEAFHSRVSLGMWRFLSLFFQVNSFVSGLHQSSASLQFEGAPSILRIGLSPFMIDPSHFTWDSFSSNFRIGFQDTSRLSKAHICHICAGHGMPWLR